MDEVVVKMFRNWLIQTQNTKSKKLTTVVNASHIWILVCGILSLVSMRDSSNILEVVSNEGAAVCTRDSRRKFT